MASALWCSPETLSYASITANSSPPSSCHHGAFRTRALNLLCRMDQHFIAGLVTVFVVHALKMIEVDNQKRARIVEIGLLERVFAASINARRLASPVISSVCASFDRASKLRWLRLALNRQCWCTGANNHRQNGRRAQRLVMDLWFVSARCVPGR